MAAHLSGKIQHGPRLNPLAFSPALWLDFSDASTLFTEVGGSTNVAAGGTIAQVNDKSGNGRHATQSVVGNRPTREVGGFNGKDAGRFASDFLATAYGNTGAKTIFVVAKSASAASINRVFAFNNTYGFGDFGTGTNWGWYSNSGGIMDIPKNSLTVSLLCAVFSANTAGNIYVDGTFVNSVTPPPLVATNYAAIGAEFYDGGNNFIGDIAEIIVYPTALTTDQRQRVEKYLNEKYSIY